MSTLKKETYASKKGICHIPYQTKKLHFGKTTRKKSPAMKLTIVPMQPQKCHCVMLMLILPLMMHLIIHYQECQE